MKIVHIQMAGPYSEGYSYQENIIPRFHVAFGHQVVMLATCYSWKQGQLERVRAEKKIMESGVILERLPFQSFGIEFITRKLRWAPNLYQKLNEYEPDFIMLHDVQSVSNFAIRKYLRRNCNVRLVVDCHTDLLNSARNFLSKYILHGVVWKSMAQILLPYADGFLGVLPSRVKFLNDVYKIPYDKCELLVMGADDYLIKEALKKNSREKIRKIYDIKNDEILIVTGGKIDSHKKDTLNLLKVVDSFENSKVRLIIFGSISESYKTEFNKYIDEKRIINVGWLSSKETYFLFSAADVVFFAGGHSVLWEQAVGQKKPLICNKWEGTEHLDIGGNILFIDSSKKDDISNALMKVTDEETFIRMKTAAQGPTSEAFLYSNISKKVLKYCSLR